MEALIALLIPAAIVIAIVAKFSSMKDEINSLRSRHTFLSEALTSTRTELNSLRADFVQKMHERDADLEKKTRDYNAYLGQKLILDRRTVKFLRSLTKSQLLLQKMTSSANPSPKLR